MAHDARFLWFRQIVDPAPGDRLLEIGPGSSDSLAVMAELLDTGFIVGIDRSATAIARAAKRHAALIESGKVRVRNLALEKLTREQATELAPGGFDKILAVNVNAFWTRNPVTELSVLRDCLTPGGAVHLFYGYGEPGPPTSIGPVATPRNLIDHLAGAGFDVETATSGELLGVIATPR
ncbi:class I SAM-dependent methyltransferase [Nocardia cyriacigeorgica]|uniref:Class I SAM-dependent methyltransferase n=1 Tax=Nocardia cyriacigeorgica TaxID=135487 RepID=A0A6P1D6Q2_9NOCA|nr:class I SAM-dependent methyltransferase [Nocardia cyriacigeorgica]NEW38858.1 class I SAM-dependent methyltransferase [Nocardia cyriacigeorgica]NEW46316.1 class I SAM-dependent methyltransferase [Nocardia cyriacigeorgica]NEW50415.1 class I SAM-dependent methyltransferase [Nocardia cyriacigeorgica]NEW58084.1 class I SAM-dependent methyltransferase [Nocardia cyriacigeorgica]